MLDFMHFLSNKPYILKDIHKTFSDYLQVLNDNLTSH